VEVSGQFHAPWEPCLPHPSSVLTEYEGGWAPEVTVGHVHCKVTRQNMPDETCYNDQVRTNINGHMSDTARFRAGLQNWLEISQLKESITFRLAERETLPFRYVFDLCKEFVMGLRSSGIWRHVHGRLVSDVSRQGSGVVFEGRNDQWRMNFEELTVTCWKNTKRRRFCC
jgi:hypothetical protein